MKKFIYVFNIRAYRKMLNAGFVCLRADDEKSMFVFAAKDELITTLDKINESFILSDSLTL